MDATADRKRDSKVISLIGAGHGVSHLFQLTLPPLFPLLHAEGYSFTQLGLIITVMYVASGVLQPFAGILVDRIGARLLWLLGMTAMATGTFVYGIAPSYEVMLAGAALIGIGNSVFHPCGYSVLSATVGEARLGRAFGLHIFGGYLGYGLAFAVMPLLGNLFGWRQAVIAVSLAGLAAIAAIAAQSGSFRDSRHEKPADAAPSPARSGTMAILFSAPILLSWLFFMVMALGQIGLQTKTVAILTLPDTYGMSAELAGIIVFVMIVSVAMGLLYGGYVADRTARHDRVVTLCYSLAGAAMLVLYLFPMPVVGIFAVFLVTGFAYGIAFPSRDLLVRRAAPKGSSGKVFGFVYAGMDVGSMAAPVLFGWFIDRGIPQAGFLCVAALWFAGMLLIRFTTRMAANSRPVVAAG